jgi:hypothetical protein
MASRGGRGRRNGGRPQNGELATLLGYEMTTTNSFASTGRLRRNEPIGEDVGGFNGT